MAQFCDNCGNEMLNGATLCPVCGTLSDTGTKQAQRFVNHELKGQQGQQTSFSQDDFRNFGGPPPQYQQGYGPVPGSAPQPTGYPYPPQQAHGYASASYASLYPPYSQGPINVTVINRHSSDGAVVAEILLSLIGIFGVGWMIGGETTIGIILLICSIFIFWPFMILGTLFTFGLGLLCLIPLAIGAIILNALLCASAMKRRASQFVVMQPPLSPQMPMPPMQRPQ